MGDTGYWISIGLLWLETYSRNRKVSEAEVRDIQARRVLEAVAYEAAEDERRWREFDAQLEQASVSLAKRINDAFAAQEQATARCPRPKCIAARQAAKGN